MFFIGAYPLISEIGNFEWNESFTLGIFFSRGSTRFGFFPTLDSQEETVPSKSRGVFIGLSYDLLWDAYCCTIIYSLVSHYPSVRGNNSTCIEKNAWIQYQNLRRLLSILVDWYVYSLISMFYYHVICDYSFFDSYKYNI